MISLDPREFSRALARRGFFTTLVDVRVDGVVHRTLPRDVQYHPATDAPLHVDFMRLGSHARVTVSVPVVFTNPEMSPGIRRGGILNIVRHGIELNCPVDRIPDHLVVELNGLEIGESLHISRVVMPEGCRHESLHISRVVMPEGCRPTITDHDFTIATIAASSAVREEAAAAATAAPAPEQPAAS